MMRALFIGALLALASTAGLAQQPVAPCVTIAGQLATSCVPVSSTNPLPVATSGSTVSTTYTAAQVSVGTTATQIVAAGSLSNLRAVQPLAANTGSCVIGPAGVTMSTGLPVAKGSNFITDSRHTTAALFAVCDAAAQTIATLGF